MRDYPQEITVTIVGAVIGGLAAYLFFTNRGRAIRRQIEPAVDSFSRELNSLRTTVRKAAGAANEGWNLLNEALGESPQPVGAPRYQPPHQTSPF